MSPSLSEQDLLLMLLAIAIILILGRGAGELARRLHQPEVLGELLAGFLLGPSVLGALLPGVRHALFVTPVSGLILSGLSWIGAVLLLLAAGLEVDLNILRRETRPGALAAAFAIVPSLIAGSAFAWLVLHRQPPSGVYLGVVLSVTGVSVVAKILMEQGTLRRAYAQVILAAGITSEVLVWLMIAVMSSLHSGSPLLALARSAIFAVGFFLLMMTVARRFVFWSMRRVSDLAWIIRGQVSLVLVLTFLAAAATQALGLHALLGAFVMGVLLAQAPRSNERLLEGLQTVTVTMFSTIFFVLAGMRVDIFSLRKPSALLVVLALLVVATVVKIGLAGLGARLGGLRGWEALLVGTGLNLKGGTDVIVAILGTELGLLSVSSYTIYAVVAILTVLFSPVLIRWLQGKVPATGQEEERLEREEAGRRAYVPRLERVLVPIAPSLLPTLAASVVERIATAKHDQGEVFDITELVIERTGKPAAVRPTRAEQATVATEERLDQAGTLDQVEVTQKTVDPKKALAAIRETKEDFDLIAMGARPPTAKRRGFSLGRLQDMLIDTAQTDVLVAIDHQASTFDCSQVQHILVPTNGLEYSMSAGDIAGALAEACQADICLLHVVQPSASQMYWREQGRDALLRKTSQVVDELAFRLSRYQVKVHTEVRVAGNAGRQIVRELENGQYQLVVMGGVDRGRDSHLYLGRAIETVLLRMAVPAVLLITHE